MILNLDTTACRMLIFSQMLSTTIHVCGTTIFEELIAPWANNHERAAKPIYLLKRRVRSRHHKTRNMQDGTCNVQHLHLKLLVRHAGQAQHSRQGNRVIKCISPPPAVSVPFTPCDSIGNGGGAGPSTWVNRVLPRSGGQWWRRVKVQLGGWDWNWSGTCSKSMQNSDQQLRQHRWRFSSSFGILLLAWRKKW